MSAPLQTIQPPNPPLNQNPNTLATYSPSSGPSTSASSVRHNPLTAPTITIPIQIECQTDKFNETFQINIEYIKSITIHHLIKYAINRLNTKHDPLQFSCITYSGQSFICHAISPKSLEYPITNYNRSHLTQSGMKIQVIVKKFVHRITVNPITCKYMLKAQQFIPESCPLYNAMKNSYDYKARHLLHLKNYNHFQDQFGDKPPCRYASDCNAFRRLEENGYNFNDLCHLQIYRHPPRQDVIHLKSNINALLINTKNDENHCVYEPTDDDKTKYEWNQEKGFVNALISEVIRNGYEECLHLNDIVCDHKYSLLSIVYEKLQCSRHKQMNTPLNTAQMLSIVLYTGTDCNYLLCKRQRNGDYDTWKWFDFCLFNAVRLLSIHETAEYKLFSGLKKVILDKRMVNTGFFKTYQSSSWRMEVAIEFLGEEDGGMIIVMDKQFRKHTYCCDVSWISKFKDECEVLISRSVGGENTFSLKVMEQNYNWNKQIVSLYFKP